MDVRRWLLMTLVGLSAPLQGCIFLPARPHREVVFVQPRREVVVERPPKVIVEPPRRDVYIERRGY